MPRCGSEYLARRRRVQGNWKTSINVVISLIESVSKERDVKDRKAKNGWRKLWKAKKDNLVLFQTSVVVI